MVKRILNTTTGRYYQLRQKNTSNGTVGQIMGLWSPKRTSKRENNTWEELYTTPVYREKELKLVKQVLNKAGIKYKFTTESREYGTRYCIYCSPTVIDHAVKLLDEALTEYEYELEDKKRTGYFAIKSKREINNVPGCYGTWSVCSDLREEQCPVNKQCYHEEKKYRK